jgi:purine-binding chemotaxis protein CheW
MSQQQSQPVETEQVLEFRLGDETYCVSINYVTEIVDMGELTPIPNSPRHVEGVIDLRGNTTSIIDPKVGLGIDGEIGDRIIIFDSAIFDDDRSIGWAVDSVEEVSEIADESVDDAPIEGSHVRGLIKRESEFVVWINPKQMDEEFAKDEDLATPDIASEAAAEN